MTAINRVFALSVLALACVACASSAPQSLSPGDRALVATDLSHTRRAGVGPRFRPPPTSQAVSIAMPIGPWRCLSRRVTTYDAHLEVFAYEHEVLVPGGIGVSQPRFAGYALVAGRCSYPLRTIDPTGVVQVQNSRSTPRLAELFAFWGQPLAREQLGAFTGPVTAFVAGRRWDGDPRTIPLGRHAQIVLELGGFVPPHRSYGFPRGL